MIAQTKETLLKRIDHTRPQILLVAFYRVQGVWGSFEKPQSPMSMHLWFGHMHGMITVISLHRALAADSEFMTLQLTGKKVPKVVIFVVNQKNTSQWKFTTGRCSSLKVTRLSRGSSWAQQSPQYFCLKHNSLLCLQYGQRTPAQYIIDIYCRSLYLNPYFPMQPNNHYRNTVHVTSMFKITPTQQLQQQLHHQPLLKVFDSATASES